MQQSSNYDIMANIKSSQHLKLDVASLKADIAIASKTDDFQNVSKKIKVLTVKDQVEFGERMKQVLQGMKYLTQWSTALKT